MNKTIVSVGVAVAMCGAVGATFAQGVILPAGAITREVLIQELRPVVPGTKFRNIKVRPAGTQGESKQGMASVLVTFHTNSAEITPDAASSLDVIASALLDNQLSDFRFQVEGHADPRGDDEYNRLLSQARAESVANYLAERHGVDRQRLMPIGRGTSQVLNVARPAAPENRRVTLIRQD